MIDKLTVLMTTYNCGEFISDAIKSVLNQTFSNLEFLIIDDGSTDGTENIVKGFSDKKIIYKRIRHIGYGKVFNLGLKLAKYKWIAILDADDIWHAKKLEEQIKVINSEKDLIFTNSAYFIDEKIIYLSDRLKNRNELYRKLLIHGHFSSSSVLLNKNHILEYGGFDDNLYNSEDYDLWLRLIFDFNFKVVDEYLTFIRIRNNSLSRRDVSKTANQIHNIQRKHFPIIFNNNRIVQNINVNEVKAWSEFFYGDKRLARKYWMLSKKFTLKIIVSFVISFLPRKILTSVLNYRFRLKFNYLLLPTQSQKIFDKDILEIK